MNIILLIKREKKLCKSLKVKNMVLDLGTIVDNM